MVLARCRKIVAQTKNTSQGNKTMGEMASFQPAERQKTADMRYIYIYIWNSIRINYQLYSNPFMDLLHISMKISIKLCYKHTCSYTCIPTKLSFHSWASKHRAPAQGWVASLRASFPCTRDSCTSPTCQRHHGPPTSQNQLLDDPIDGALEVMHGR